MLVSGRRPDHFVCLGIDSVMSLRRSLDAVGPVQTGVEPLRRIGGGHLSGQHIAGLVEEDPRVVLAGKVAAFPAPIGPAAGQSAKYLPGIGLLAGGRIPASGSTPLQPLRDSSFPYPLGLGRHTGPAKVFLRQNVHGHLRPGFRRLQLLHLEHHRSVRIDDARRARGKRDGGEGILTFGGVTASNNHGNFRVK